MLIKVPTIDRYVALGYSRKFWFDDKLCTNLSSITSPDIVKKVYLDPALLPLVKDQRVLIVDDAISSGVSPLPIHLDILAICRVFPY
jgi:adenine/guanine phosphoribosyltransferase-like PRPP-binding protein